MEKAPAFQLYAADFYMDTASWTIEEVGIYTRLLFFQWVNGCIPMDEIRLSRIAGCSLKTFRKSWDGIHLKFSPRDHENLINLRLEESRIKQDEYHNARKLGGKITAKKRWGEKKTDSSANSSASSSTVALPSSSSSSINKVSKSIFIIPKVDEVSSYCSERKNGINPQVWMDHYTSNGWKVGKNPMRDWKAAIRTWESRGGNGNGNGYSGGESKTPGKTGGARSDGAAYPVDVEC